jgi:hypothetical protein
VQLLVAFFQNEEEQPIAAMPGVAMTLADVSEEVCGFFNLPTERFGLFCNYPEYSRPVRVFKLIQLDDDAVCELVDTTKPQPSQATIAVRPVGARERERER